MLQKWSFFNKPLFAELTYQIWLLKSCAPNTHETKKKNIYCSPYYSPYTFGLLASRMFQVIVIVTPSPISVQQSYIKHIFMVQELLIIEKKLWQKTIDAHCIVKLWLNTGHHWQCGVSRNSWYWISCADYRSCFRQE